MEEPFLSRGHGPSSFGGAGAQFPPRFEDVPYDFSKLEISDKQEKDGAPQISKSTRTVSFNTTRGTPRRCEYYSFTKGDDWKVADRIKISAPQDELEKKVSKGKKSSSVLETLVKMSPDRRAQIDRLLDQKNATEESRDAQWHCVFIDSPGTKVKEVGGRRIREHKKMNVIVAQHLLSGRVNSTSEEEGKSFIGERSDISEPLKPKDRSKDKHAKGGKESKNANHHRDDPFDRKRLFDDNGAPMDKYGPIPEYPPQHPHYIQGMGQPFGPPGVLPMGNFHPAGPAGHPIFGNPFSQPGPVQQLTPGIEIIDDRHPPHNGANGVFHLEDLPPGQDQIHPPERNPQFHRPQLEDFNGAAAPYRKQSKGPVVVQGAPKGRRNYTKKWMYDDSSRESDDESCFFDEDEHSSHTSYGDDHEKLVRRGSLVPHRRSSVKRREPTYREHHRVSSYPLELPRRRLEPAQREGRYHGHHGVETIIERRPRRHSSRGRSEAIKYFQPKRLEYQQSRSPPLTPISHSSYSHSPSRRYSGLASPREILEHDREHERREEEYLHEKHLRGREEAVKRRERDLDDRELFERSMELDRLGRRVSGQDRYWPPSR